MGRWINCFYSDWINWIFLSCGGPVISPTSGSFVLTPISPHNLNVRPLVISDSTNIELSVSGREKNHLLSIDSKIFTIENDTIIKIEKAEFNFKIAHFQIIVFMNL